MNHQFVFGEAPEKAVGALVNIAATEATAEAFTKAADGLRGIRIFISSMGLARQIEVDLNMRLLNEERRLRQVSQDPKLLEEIISAIRDNEG